MRHQLGAAHDGRADPYAEDAAADHTYDLDDADMADTDFEAGRARYPQYTPNTSPINP